MNLRKALVIAGTNLRRLMRDKTGAFFVLVFPLSIILALGAAFGSARNSRYSRRTRSRCWPCPACSCVEGSSGWRAERESWA